MQEAGRGVLWREVVMTGNLSGATPFISTGEATYKRLLQRSVVVRGLYYILKGSIIRYNIILFFRTPADLTKISSENYMNEVI